MADAPPRGPDRRWRVGIVGAGGISGMHARMLVESPTTDLVAVADPHPVRRGIAVCCERELVEGEATAAYPMEHRGEESYRIMCDHSEVE